MAAMAEQPLLPFGDDPVPDHSSSRSSLLIDELARICREGPLDEKILVVPSLQLGHQLLERLAREGHPWMHLRVETVRTLAHALVGSDLAREGLRLLSRAQTLALVEQACAESLQPGSYFGALRQRPGLHRALQRTLEELRAAGIEPGTIPDSAFADLRKPREIAAVLARYESALSKGQFVDSLEVLRRAIQRVSIAPSRPAVYLLPEDAELSDLERRFLEGLAGDDLRVLSVDPPSAWTAQAASARMLRAIGEENEIRAAFRTILEDRIPFDDVEILHTDASVYPALVWELAREHEIPCTFGGGIAVTYTRPGQAALAFLGWIADGFAADRLREALSSRALTLRSLRQSEEESPGSSAVARAFRDARVGWGRSRHVTALDRFIRSLEAPPRPSRRDEELSEAEAAKRADARARRLAAARVARQFAQRAVELAPDPAEPTDSLGRLARGARTFVSEFGRVAGDLDATARNALEALFDEIALLPSAGVPVGDAVERLRDAVLELSVAADRPRPGRVASRSTRREGTRVAGTPFSRPGRLTAPGARSGGPGPSGRRAPRNQRGSATSAALDRA